MFAGMWQGAKAGDSTDILWQNDAWGDKVFFNSTGNLLSVTDQSGYAILINTKNGNIIKTYNVYSGWSSQKFSKDGKVFAYSPNYGGIVFINTETFDTLKISKIESYFFDFSKDGNSFITAYFNIDGFRLNKYDIKTDSLQTSFNNPFIPNYYDGWMTDFVVSPSSNKVAFRAGAWFKNQDVGTSYDYIFNLDNNKVLGNIASTEAYIKYSASGIVAAIDSGKINFYEDNGKLIKTLPGWHRDFCFNDIDNEIITATSTELKMWDFNTLKLKSTYNNPVFGDGPGLVTFNPANNLLIVIKGGCYAFDYSKIVSVKDNNDVIPKLTISPNPSTDFLEISLPSHALKDVAIHVYNVFGEILLSSSHYSILTTQYSAKLDVSSLPPGVYFFKVGEKLRKFVKM